MRKFFQLAEDTEADLKDMDHEADALNERRLRNKEAARQAINNHHRLQDKVEQGIKAMAGITEALGISNEREYTAAELAEIAKEEEAAKKQPPAGSTPNSGEGSGATPVASFSTAAS